MAYKRDDFFSGEDLEDILDLIEGGFLDDDEVLNTAIDNIALELEEDEEKQGFSCNLCDKICLSKGGLTRHINKKHPSSATSSSTTTAGNKKSSTSKAPTTISNETTWAKLHPLKLKQIVVECAEKLSNDQCYPEDFRLNFSGFIISNTDAEILWTSFKNVIDSFNGDAEKFYSAFFAVMNMENLMPSKFDMHHVTNYLLCEVANHVLFHLSGVNVETDNLNNEPVASLSNKEYKSLQYLAGFILRKMYAKFQFSKSRNKKYHEQFLLIIDACKVDHDATQTLVNIRDRGGLWRVNEKMQKIFFHSEMLFLKVTKNFTTKIVTKELVQQTLKDSSVISYYKTICETVEHKIDKEISKNLLEHMLTLYFRVRTFSFAKDVREKYKAAKKKAKSRSLLTSIKITSSSKDLAGH